MISRAVFFVALSLTLAACASEAPIRKTNCWSTMTLMPSEGGAGQSDCEFSYVPAR